MHRKHFFSGISVNYCISVPLELTQHHVFERVGSSIAGSGHSLGWYVHL